MGKSINLFSHCDSSSAGAHTVITCNEKQTVNNYENY